MNELSRLWLVKVVCNESTTGCWEIAWNIHHAAVSLHSSWFLCFLCSFVKSSHASPSLLVLPFQTTFRHKHRGDRGPVHALWQQVSSPNFPCLKHPEQRFSLFSHVRRIILSLPETCPCLIAVGSHWCSLTKPDKKWRQPTLRNSSSQNENSHHSHCTH